MTSIGGLIGAGLMTALCFLIIAPAAGNLTGAQHAAVLAVSLAVGILVGGLTGSTIFRRAKQRTRRLGLFSGVAAGVGGGLVGAAWMLAVLTGYMTTYGYWPEGIVDQVLTVLAFPLLAAFGFTIGGLLCGLAGLVAGGVLGFLLPARR
jgi:hypothetical protein